MTVKTKDVSLEVGVYIATITHALNEGERVDPAIRQKILGKRSKCTKAQYWATQEILLR
jgi:hypothetical protein